MSSVLARLAVLSVALLGSCAVAPPMTDEEQVAQILARYGPECGVPADALRTRTALSQGELDCIVKRVRATQQSAAAANRMIESLGRGMEAAGGILSPDVYNMQRGYPPASSPAPRSTDYRCVQECTTRGYQHALCMARCSY